MTRYYDRMKTDRQLLDDLAVKPIDLGFGISIRQVSDNQGKLRTVLRVPTNFVLEIEGDLIENVKGNIIHNTPRQPDPDRPGYNFGIYDVCPLDEYGRPRATRPLYEDGKIVATFLGIYHPDGTPDLGPKSDHLSLTTKPRVTIHDHHELERRMESMSRRLSEVEGMLGILGP